MVVSAFRKTPLKAPWAVALMLGCAVVPAHAGLFSSDSKPVAKVEEKSAAPATTLEDSIRQAQMLRLAGLYPDAIKHLSQLMMVASDDGRVISEYGKTLAAMGRASDAVNFLTRAQQLQPGDWTIYSALGVAYDQMGDQKSAQAAYEHALAIKPNEPSVLNNYALSRMLAKDPEMAGKLAARAESAGGMSEPKIARNIAMIRSLALETHTVAQAANTPSPLPQQALPQAQPQVAKVQIQSLAAPVRDDRVVMQRVPVDPLAGPVTAPAHAPRPLQAKVATPSAADPKPDAPAKQVLNTPVAKIATNTPATPVSSALPSTSVKTADTNKPVSVPAPKTLIPTPAKTADANKPAPVKAADADKTGTAVSLKMAPPTPVKATEANKPASAPTVLPPVKTTDAKAVPVKAAAAAKPKDTVPGLRMSANAY
jgi:Flp pilus assembly protein TadD